MDEPRERCVKFENFDSVLQTVGAFGRYQMAFVGVYQLFLFVLCLNTIFMPLAVIQPEIICQLRNGTLIKYERTNPKPFCKHYESGRCWGVDWESPFHTLVEEWKLICSRDYIPQLLNSVQMSGLLLTVLFAGQISDSFGRRAVLLGSSFLVLLLNFLGTLATNPIIFAVNRFFFGGLLGAVYQTSILWGMELTDKKHTILINISQLMHFAYMGTAGIAYGIPNWNHLLLTLGIVSIPFFLAFSRFHESPRWLASKGRFEEAAMVLNRIGEFNKKSDGKITANSLIFLRSDKAPDQLQKPRLRPNTFLTLFRNRKLFMYSAILTQILFTCGVSSNAYLFGVSYMPGNPFLKFFLYGAIRIWLPVAVYLIDRRMDRLGRKPLLYIPLYITLASFVAVQIGKFYRFMPPQVYKKLHLTHSHLPQVVTGSLLDWNPIVTFVGSLFAAVIVNMLFIGLTQIQMELFPTVVRHTAMGLVCVAEPAAGILMPQLIYLQKIWTGLPYLLINSCCVISLLCAHFLLPETKNLKIPESIEDMDCSDSRSSTFRNLPPPSSADLFEDNDSIREGLLQAANSGDDSS